MRRQVRERLSDNWFLGAYLRLSLRVYRYVFVFEVHLIDMLWLYYSKRADASVNTTNKSLLEPGF